MTTPVQATLAIPPCVENVAVGFVLGGGVVWPEGAGLGTGVVVVTGRGDLGTLVCGDRDEDAPGNDAGGGMEAGRVELGPLDGWTMLVDVVSMTAEPDATSFTTSAWATTAGGRSVTSAATMEVAAHTIAVDPAQAASHRLVVDRRGGRTDQECHYHFRPDAKGTLSIAAAHAPSLVPATEAEPASEGEDGGGGSEQS